MRFHFETLHLEKTPGTVDELLFTAGIFSNDNGKHDIYWDNYSTANQVTVAWTESGRLAGVHVYYEERTEGDGQLLRSQVTWVEERYRRRGLAQDMWQVSLADVQPDHVQVFCINPASRALIARLESQHPQISWSVGFDYGDEVELAA